MKVILVADNDLTRRIGLMHHSPLQKDECAYFHFDKLGKHSFWNKNVDFPISLIFCDDDCVVKDIKTLEAQQLNAVMPDDYKIRHVIEAHIDAVKEYGIKKGSKIKVKGEEVHFE